MRHHFLTLVLTLGLAACDTSSDQPTVEAAPAPATPATGLDLPPGHPTVGASGGAAAAVVGEVGHSGTVAQTMNSAGFTYVRIGGPDSETWLAAPEAQVAVGDQVSAPTGLLMVDFQSPSLGRTFAQLYMVESLQINGAAASPSSAATTDAWPAVAGGLIAPVPPLEGGQTIAQLFADRALLNGKEVAVRGQVVKVSPNIMDRNWVHLQDGSGDPTAKTNDLTLTTEQTVVVGQVVVARGTLAADRDFGMGYRYDAIVEGARFE
jgi:hypothetical protein